MNWDEEVVEILRVMLNDLDEELYQEDNLLRIVYVAALQVSSELSLGFTIDVINQSVTPNPVDPRNDSFINLVTLKAACIVDRGSAAIAANQAIAVRDGSSSIDLRASLQGKLSLLKQGWCAVYQDAKNEFMYSDNGRAAGIAVMGPFRDFYWARRSNDRGCY